MIHTTIVWKGLLEVTITKHPLKAVPTSKLDSTLKLDQVSWGPIQSSLEYFQGWTLQIIPGALVWCLTIFMAGKLKKTTQLLQLITISHAGAYVSVGSHHTTTKLPEEPDYSCSIHPLLHLLPSGSWRGQWGPISIHLILWPNKPISSHLAWHIWCSRIPSTSSAPVCCVPRHQSMMLHSFSHQKTEFFATCL